MSSRRLLLETPEDYHQLTYPKAIKKSKQWVLDIFAGKREQDRIIYQNDELVLVPNIEWSPLSEVRRSPLSEVRRSPPWDEQTLHVMAFYKRSDLRSLRDLKGSDVEMLKRTYYCCRNLIAKRYGLHIDTIKAYFHYAPTVWQLHLHFVHINEKDHCGIENSHNIEYVIQNLEMMPDYYQKVTLQIDSNESS